MGIFRDLVSNFANSKMKEEQQKLQYNLGLGDILTTLISNPYTDPGTLAKASGYYQDLMGKHGGKEGKALQSQIGQFLNIYQARRAHDRALGIQPGQDASGQQAPPQQPTGPYPAAPLIQGMGGTQPQAGPPEAAPGGGAMEPEKPVPAGQTAGQPGGVNYGWPTGQATPASLISATQSAAQGRAPIPYFPRPGEKGGGAGGFLHTLAGIGGELMGIPRAGDTTPTKEQISQLYGPTPEQAAQQKGREAGIMAGAEKTAQLQAALDQFKNPTFIKTLKDRGMTESQINEAMLRTMGVPAAQLARTPVNVYEPDGTRHSWSIDKDAQYYDELGQPKNLGQGWYTEKIGASRSVASDMAPALKPSYQSAVTIFTQLHQHNGTWDEGWSPERVNKEANLQAAIQFQRLRGAQGTKAENDAMLATTLSQMNGFQTPAPWMSDGAEWQNQIDAATGNKARPSVFDRPIPKKGEPITDPAMAAAYDEFVLRASGTMPFGRQDQWAQPRYELGMRIAMAQVGTDNPSAIVALFKDKAAEAKTFTNTVGRFAGVETLNGQLQAFGQLLIDARSRFDGTGVPLIDRYLQQATRGLGDLTGDQAAFVSQIDVAVNAVSRIYAQVLSNNGYMSAAMPHVGTENEARAMLNSYLSNKTIEAELDIMKTEANRDMGVLKQRQTEQFNQLAESLPETMKRLSGGGGAGAGGGRGGGNAPPPPPPAGKPKTADDFLKNRGLLTPNPP